MHNRFPEEAVHVAAAMLLLLCEGAFSASYYVDAVNGADSNTGTSVARAWRTLAPVNAMDFQPGDTIHLKRGSVFSEELNLARETGAAGKSIRVAAYGEPQGGLPHIKGGIIISSSRWIELKDLELSGKGVKAQSWGPWQGAEYTHVWIDGLYVHDSEGGINLVVANESPAFFSDILITNCRLENIKAYGAVSVNKWGQDSSVYHQNVRILDNRIKTTTGAGIQVGKIKKCTIRGNRTDDTGNDPKTGGDGLWTWFCHDLLAEYNVFKGAEGHADACGAHIDMGCRNNIFQYNISMDNEGGFVEILGDSYNCVYRYNVSINDGARVKGKNGARQNGKVFWLNGYKGKKQPFVGPFNSYVYNNTIYVGKGITANFKMDKTAKGGLFANNVIYYEGAVADISQMKGEDLVLHNNLLYGKTIPECGFTRYEGNWHADPGFRTPGGLKVSDYVPTNRNEIVDRSISLYNLPGDEVGVSGGFRVEKDILGNPIKGVPDMGAIEIQ